MKRLVLPDGTVAGQVKEGVAPPTTLPDGSPLPQGTKLVPMELFEAPSGAPGLTVPSGGGLSAGDANRMLPGALAIGGAMAAPALVGGGLPAGLGALARIILSGAGMTTGRQAGQALTGGEMFEPGQMSEDFLTGATSEMIGSTIGWSAKTAGKVLNLAKKMKGVPDLGGMAQSAVEQGAQAQAGKLWQRLKKLVPDDTPMPAPKTLELVEQIAAGKWKGKAAEDVSSAARGTPLMKRLRRLREGNEGAWSVRQPDLSAKPQPQGSAVPLKTTQSPRAQSEVPWVFDEVMADVESIRRGEKATSSTFDPMLLTKPEKGWTPHYVVFDDGTAMLALQHPATGAWKDGTKPGTGNMFPDVDKVIQKLGGQKIKANPVAVVPANPATGDAYLKYASGFEVERIPTVTFGELNDLMSNTTTFPGYANVGKEGQALVKALRDAVREDIKAYGPEVEKTINRALMWGRVSKDAGKYVPPVLKQGGKLGAITTKEALQRIAETTGE